MNFVNAKITKPKGQNDCFLEFDNISFKLDPVVFEDNNLSDYIGKEVIAGLRPELLHDEAVYKEKFGDTTIKARVEFTELMGAEIYLYLNIGEETSLISRVSSQSTAKAGDEIEIAVDTTRIHIFDKDTEKCIVHFAQQ